MTQQFPYQSQGLPPSAAGRLQGLDRGEGRPPMFTSDLSVNEFLLVRQAGFTPLGLVVGSSIYHIGIQQARWSQSQELQVLSQAMYHARELAMSRMEAEADVLGADGVVGVRLDIRFYQWGEHMAEFIAVGTAVRAPQGQSWRTPAGRPFTSNLSGQDFWTLTQAGYTPCALVLGTCVYHVAHQGLMQTLRQVGQNVEMPQFTQATYDAREIAMYRMQAEALQAQADGIVGVTLTESAHVWGLHAIEFFALGTAVRATRADHAITPPGMVMPLA